MENYEKIIKNIKSLNLEDLSDAIVEYYEKNNRIIFVGVGMSSDIISASLNDLGKFNINNLKATVLSGTKSYSDEMDEYIFLEEEHSAAIFELDKININNDDLVIGVTVSGLNKYVSSALSYAKSLGCKTSLITPYKSHVNEGIDYIIEGECNGTGMFDLSGINDSTLLKIIIDHLIYLVMQKLGRVWRGIAIYERPVASRIQENCIRFLIENFNLDHDQAREKYISSDKVLAVAIVSLIKDINPSQAKELLSKNKFNINDALA